MNDVTIGYQAGVSTDDDLRASYIDLLEKCITMRLWDAGEAPGPIPKQRRSAALRLRLVQYGKRALRRWAPWAEKSVRDFHWRNIDIDFPNPSHSMLGPERMRNLRECVERVLRDDVPGDFIEAGVWRGGACILMRGILRAYGVTDRRVWVADSFAGCPPPSPEYPLDAEDRLYKMPSLAVPLDEVKRNFSKYELLDNQVQFLEGWFRDTLPSAPIQQLALVRLDGDLYESTMDGIQYLYPKLSRGGFLIVDDYGSIEACRQAVHDYRTAHGIREPVQAIDKTGVFWRRT